jgi:cytochrome c oxidase subunit 2
MIGPVLRGALALTLALGGCAWDAPMSTVKPHSDYAHEILHVYGIITWVTLGIALIVGLGLAWVLIRFHARPESATLPVQTRGHTLLEMAWTIGPALVLLGIAIPTIQVVFRTQAAPPRDALAVTVRGHQWWWEFQYPTLQVVTANELHVPVGRPVALTLEGPDVIHSFWVPQLGGKRDVVPGRLNRLTFTAERPGEYRGQCAEFCGTSHANMGLRVIVDAPEVFTRWVAAQKVQSPEPSAGPAADGKAIFARSACVGCHTIRGVSSGAIGPDLSTFGSRHTMGAGILPTTIDNVTAWIKNPSAIKPDAKMPALGLTDEQARAVATYLIGLK